MRVGLTGSGRNSFNRRDLVESPCAAVIAGRRETLKLSYRGRASRLSAARIIIRHDYIIILLFLSEKSAAIHVA